MTILTRGLDGVGGAVAEPDIKRRSGSAKGNKFPRSPHFHAEVRAGANGNGLGRNRGSASGGPGSLAGQELEIVRWVVTGYNNQAIARELGLTGQVVGRSIAEISEKLRVSNRLELALYAVFHKLAG
jgi:DNA-binding NarL/FixJ family response regulator